ncbi:IclR family transcriptional regulator domain-containing protein [Pseudomonas asiatica]|uniref:IclR family transcriptional regulator C-terminal domain-containing protein n=1 Tax=Pseudomonas asiatica TaxID=2219225 RepID=A0ABU5L3R4_9PSED|nr:IclR family transcriptional regulator C-terminal domain-containing protein [Pseudomonas asiatica]MDZ5740558.1 IclR family transcriptional regulator C-terminal domain-containing protein [Pseudomonas asiatica]MDZ5745252.1 IclR family transcriptional regulator C-terminal domain-containing protein [Pseudomonas asiatica]MDZ5750840.1 IclR family transcriptional regulator C-terminal domain-containing protein [Pseudomonas asiatica]MDZ5755785.1 IclR family transcriptional regulator C-terminal domain-
MNNPFIHTRDLIAGLQKGLALMQLFSAEQPRLSVPQAARLSGLTPSAARRFLLTLVHEGFAETDSREYWLTPKALRLGQAYVDSAQLPRMLRPIVEQVARQTQEHVSVGTRDGDEIIHLVRSRYSHVSSLSIRPGSRVPMYCTAGGRVWLAWLDEGERDAYFARNPLRGLTPYTQTDRLQLEAELLRVKEQGFCIVDQEYEIGMRVLGVPLLDRAGRLKATLTITTHASRLSVDEIRLRYLSTLYEAQALLRPVLD